MLAIRSEEAFAGLHKDEEFQKLLEQMGMPPVE